MSGVIQKLPAVKTKVQIWSKMNENWTLPIRLALASLVNLKQTKINWSPKTSLQLSLKTRVGKAKATAKFPPKRFLCFKTFKAISLEKSLITSTLYGLRSIIRLKSFSPSMIDFNVLRLLPWKTELMFSLLFCLKIQHLPHFSVNFSIYAFVNFNQIESITNKNGSLLQVYFSNF